MQVLNDIATSKKAIEVICLLFITLLKYLTNALSKKDARDDNKFLPRSLLEKKEETEDRFLTQISDLTEFGKALGQVNFIFSSLPIYFYLRFFFILEVSWDT